MLVLVLVLFDLVLEFALGGGVDLHHSPAAAERDEGLISTQISREDSIEFITDRGETFTGPHLEQNHLAGFHRTAACHHQDGAVAAEADDVRDTFREWKSTKNLLGIGVKQSDMPLTGHGHEGSPRTDIHSQYR